MGCERQQRWMDVQSCESFLLAPPLALTCTWPGSLQAGETGARVSMQGSNGWMCCMRAVQACQLHQEHQDHQDHQDTEHQEQQEQQEHQEYQEHPAATCSCAHPLAAGEDHQRQGTAPAWAAAGAAAAAAGVADAAARGAAAAPACPLFWSSGALSGSGTFHRPQPAGARVGGNMRRECLSMQAIPRLQTLRRRQNQHVL